MISERIQQRIQLVLGLLMAVSGAYILWVTRDEPDMWVILSIISLVAALVWSGFRKVSSGLMFLLSVTAMVFAVLYWPVPKGMAIGEQKIDPVEFFHSIWYFAVFLVFGYLYWYNRKRW